MIFNFSCERKYRHKLTIDILSSIGDGQLIAKGHGHYPEVEKEPIAWVAIKGHGHNDFAIYYHFYGAADSYIEHNGEKLQDSGLIKELLNCDNDVMKLYRK